MRPKPVSKYRNVKTANGFDSKKEERVWNDLVLLQKAGQISGLERQRRFNIVINDKKVCAYVADFCFIENGVLIVADCKSDFTKKNPVYRLKYKMMIAVLGITIREL